MEMKFYVAPEVELVEVAVEAGFAASNGSGFDIPDPL
jgi:hypothetical protein